MSKIHGKTKSKRTVLIAILFGGAILAVLCAAGITIGDYINKNRPLKDTSAPTTALGETATISSDAYVDEEGNVHLYQYKEIQKLAGQYLKAIKDGDAQTYLSFTNQDADYYEAYEKYVTKDTLKSVYQDFEYRTYQYADETAYNTKAAYGTAFIEEHTLITCKGMVPDDKGTMTEQTIYGVLICQISREGAVYFNIRTGEGIGENTKPLEISAMEIFNIQSVCDGEDPMLLYVAKEEEPESVDIKNKLISQNQIRKRQQAGCLLSHPHTVA